MKSILVFAVALFAVVYSEELYTTENDNLDIDAVLSDKAQTKAFLDCFLDKGACEGPLSDFRKDLPEAIQQACAKCTKAQKVLLRKFIDGIHSKNPAGYQSFKDKYDPENKLFVPLKAAIANS